MPRSLRLITARPLLTTIAASSSLLACLTVWPSFAAPAMPEASSRSSQASTVSKTPDKSASTVQKLSNIVALSAEPAQVSLRGPRDRARVLLTAQFADGSLQDVSDRATITPQNPATVIHDADGTLRPRKDGQTTVQYAYAGKKAGINVTVKDAALPAPVSFNNEIVPVFTRLGCNQGACHGAQYGKGGFKLSLAGFDPDMDYINTVKQAKGRRLSIADPTRSLLLRKPLMQSPHGGGLRLERDTDAYRTLVQWLRDGAPGPRTTDPVVTKIEVIPAERVLQKGGAPQHLNVSASFSDGTTRDVTADTRLNTLNDGVAACTPDGLVTAVGKGQTAIMVRYNGQATIATILVPFTAASNSKGDVRDEKRKVRPVNASSITPAPSSTIDNLVTKKQQQLGLLASPVCDDRTFLRRVFFDLIGTAPTPQDIKDFVADTRPDKRAVLIDSLLARPEYADYWTLKWGDLLRSSRTALGVKGMWSFSNWIHTQLQENRPIDQFVHDLVIAQGSTFTNGPANYYRVANNPQDLAETTSQVFLGVRMQCARCHHHPFEKWSQADYYQFAAFFARIGLKSSTEFGLFGNEQIVRINDGGEVTHPKTGAVMRPTPLGVSLIALSGKAGDNVPNPDANGDRRQALADWLTSPGNRLFARNVANRYWGYLFSKGIVNPIDDMRVTNPPTNPQLLDFLADELTRHHYDLKYLLKIICSSQTYQRSSEATPANIKDELFFTHYLPKRLGAETLLDAIDFACGTREKFNQMPQGTRAIQLPDPNVNSDFLDTFGRPLRIISCECERTSEPNLSQTLRLMNGELVNRKVAQADSRIAKLMTTHRSLDTVLNDIYNCTLGRPPRSEERLQVMAALAFAPDPKPIFEDVQLTLLNSKEFLFNH